MTQYTGNGAYCYSNSASMLLTTIGENISPALFEVATGFSLGASLERNDMLFFDNGLSSPDKGVNIAFKNLGFNVKEEVHVNDEKMPLEQLRTDLLELPVMLGPLDMGYLSYLPNHQFLSGCDHYVLALEIADNKILLHDPAGYPYVWLPLKDLEKSWKAEYITWSEGAFRYWKLPKRVDNPSDQEIYNKSMKLFKYQYEKQIEQSNFGKNAIIFKLNQIRNSQISDVEKGHLIHFAFPLGARRSSDFSEFFYGRDDILCFLKKEQSKLFGECFTYATFGDWDKVAYTLENIAEIEYKFQETIIEHVST